MLKLATAAVAAAIIAASPAHAATQVTTDIGTINAVPYTFANGVNVTAGAITSDYVFSLGVAQTMNASTFTSAAGNPFAFTGVTLYNAMNQVLATSTAVEPIGRSGGTAIGLDQVALGTGNYRISVTGNATGGASIGSSVTFMAPVPEPATWAMMLLGFGMVGAASRYRRRETRVTYA